MEYDDITIEKHYALLILLQEQNKSVQYIYKLMTDLGYKDSDNMGIMISEIYSKHCSIKSLAACISFSHYEFTSYISFFENLYSEIKEVYSDDHPNTSWLVSKYENFIGQSEILIKMLDKFTSKN